MTIADPQNTNGTNPFYDDSNVQVFEATGTIAANDLVVVRATDDVTVKVTAADTDLHSAQSKCGVALEAGVAGDLIRVQMHGPAVINIGSGSVAVDERVIMTGTGGVADGVAPADATVLGTTKGVWLTDEIGTSNTAWAWLD